MFQIKVALSSYLQSETESSRNKKLTVSRSIGDKIKNPPLGQSFSVPCTQNNSPNAELHKNAEKIRDSMSKW